MRTYLLLIAALLCGMVFYAQESEVSKPETGQSQYIVTKDDGAVRLKASNHVTLKNFSWIKADSDFIMSIGNDAPSEDPYGIVDLTAQNQNYIYTRSYQKGMSSFNATAADESDVLEQVAYFDGLGRPMQQINIKASPSAIDILTPISYDGFGRQNKQWLPYMIEGSVGSYRSADQKAAVQAYYKSQYPDDFTGLTNAQTNAYSETAFEASPLNRVLKQAAPGKDWRINEGHPIRFEYDVNAAGEVPKNKVNLTFADNTYTPTLVGNGVYDQGELYKNTTKDENWTNGVNHTMVEFTDKQGRVVMKRTYNENIAHDTRYIYDDFGNLSYVLSPKMNGSITHLDELGYQYIYDHRNRLVEKKIPGKGWEYIVYNELDQPIMTQDANLKANNKWLFTKYDAFGRVAFTGMSNGGARKDVQTAADNYAGTHWVTKGGSNEIDNTTIYYNDSAYPSDITELHTINYYDGYTFDKSNISLPTTVLGQATTQSTKGLPTGSKIRVLGENHWITTVMGYDGKGRAIWTKSINSYLNTSDATETKLDFVGKVLQSKTTHTKGSNNAIVTVDNFAYDHQGRLVLQEQELDGNTELIAKNEYDNLGQLIKKNVGNTTANPLQEVNYTYNVRGWLKKINDTENIGTDLFAFGIKYNDIADTTKKLYNGNISQTLWESKSVNIAGNDSVSNKYTYGYDALNRINSAIDNTGNYNLESVGYDKNGNITALQRKGTSGLIDNLAYFYEGTGQNSNRLQRVSDATGNTEGFKDGAAQPTEYEYDDNGNMTEDKNKGITDITYNHLNLPTKVTVSGSNNGSIDYIYDATGVKLRKIATEGSSVTTSDYAGNHIYEGGDLQFFSTPEGYVEPKNANNYSAGFNYIYQYKDHLGNVRLSYTDNNGTTEIVEENNYYPFGLKHKGYNNVQSAARDHKYGFGGKEEQDELELAWMDFGARNYDASLGRWMNTDPLADDYVRWSPYTYTMNNPMFFTDPDGKRIKIGRNYYSYEKDRNYDDLKNDFERDTYKALDHLYETKATEITIGEGENSKTVNILEELINDKENTLKIKKGKKSSYSHSNNKLKFNPSVGVAFFKDADNPYKFDMHGNLQADYGKNSPTSVLAHELIHGYNDFYDSNFSRRRSDISTRGKILDPNGRDFSFSNGEEKYTTTLANQVNEKLKENKRTNYAIIPYKTKGVKSVKPATEIPDL